MIVQKATKYEEECEDNNQCKYIEDGDGNPDAICDVNDKCSCQESFVPNSAKLACLKVWVVLYLAMFLILTIFLNPLIKEIREARRGGFLRRRCAVP